MSHLSWILYRIRVRGLLNSRSMKSQMQLIIFLFFSVLVLASLYAGTSLLLNKLDTLNSAERYSTVLNFASKWISVGDLIKERLLAMVLLAIFFMLLFSNLVSAIGHIYLSKDTELLLSRPIPVFQIFKARFLEATLSSGWMSILFFIPVLMAYAINYQVNALELIPFFFCLIPFLAIPGCIGVCSALLIARFFPIQQTRKIFQFLSVLFVTMVVILIRAMQPEKLFSIRNFEEIQSFIENLRVPFFGYFPSTWLAEIITGLLTQNLSVTLAPAGKLFAAALVLTGISYALGKLYFYKTWATSKEISSSPVLIHPSTKLHKKFRFLPVQIQAIYAKDLLLFTRNPELWSQIFLIFAMVGLYLYNIHLLHLDKVSLYSHSIARFIAYMNTAFVGFITTSIAMRFLFPSISLEGNAFWILKTAPFPIQRLILYKFWFYLPWILVIGNLMTLLANWILAVPWPLYVINGVNISVICITNCMLAICFGTLYPQYRAENINKIFMSFGGTFFMVASLAFMFLFMMTQAYPGTLYYRATVRNLDPKSWQIALASASVLAGFILFFVSNYFPYKSACHALQTREEGRI